MSAIDSEVRELEVRELEAQIEQLRAENAALQNALSVAERERDEWRIVAEQCAPLGGEIGEASKTVEKI